MSGAVARQQQCAAGMPARRSSAAPRAGARPPQALAEVLLVGTPVTRSSMSAASCAIGRRAVEEAARLVFELETQRAAGEVVA
jgi:hypothetical protein